MTPPQDQVKKHSTHLATPTDPTRASSKSARGASYVSGPAVCGHLRPLLLGAKEAQSRVFLQRNFPDLCSFFLQVDFCKSILDFQFFAGRFEVCAVPGLMLRGRNVPCDINALYFLQLILASDRERDFGLVGERSTHKREVHWNDVPHKFIVVSCAHFANFSRGMFVNAGVSLLLSSPCEGDLILDVLVANPRKCPLLECGQT